MSPSLSKAGIQAQLLALGPIAGLAEELAMWRANHDVQAFQRPKRQGRIFDFVKGLRFSAKLIYILRENLTRRGLEVDWGQVFDIQEAHLSPECDVIIHKRGWDARWNGGGGTTGHVMDFKFINHSDVLAVISCKSLLTTVTQEHNEYCQRMKPYLRGKKLWLFAECVPKGKEKLLSQASRKAGYQRFWYLYSWNDKNQATERDQQLWLRFLDEVRRLGRRR